MNYHKLLDVEDFPKDKYNNLNIIEYCKYRTEFNKLLSDREKNKMNNYLLKLFITKYNMRYLIEKYNIDVAED